MSDPSGPFEAMASALQYVRVVLSLNRTSMRSLKFAPILAALTLTHKPNGEFALWHLQAVS
jgi:hypothetical protein